MSSVRLAVLALAAAVSIAGAGWAARSMVGRDGAEMMYVPGGEFTMGTTEPDLIKVAPPHKAYVDGFYVDKYEVTIEQFARFLNDVKPADALRMSWIVIRSDVETPERKNWWPTEIMFEDGRYQPFRGFERYPVIAVNWHAADAYCRWAGKRLPTEAEWERAARGGLDEKLFIWGNEIPTGGVIFGRSWGDNGEPAPTEKVGNYYPNGYGIFDMAGNVWEWCSDWYHTDTYKKSSRRNPKGPTEGANKVLRGGSWFNSAMVLRVALRNYAAPDNTDDAVGFRCAMDAGTREDAR